MKLEIFSVYDIKAQAHMQPTCFASRPLALRAFKNAVNGKGPFAANPEDYYLAFLGTFDEVSGNIETSIRELVANGLDQVEKE